MSIHDRGFAHMTPERRKEIARLGGKAAQQKGVAHKWTSEEARNAGLKGAESRRVAKAIRKALGES